MAKEFDFGDELRRRMAAQDVSRQRQTQSVDARRHSEEADRRTQLRESIARFKNPNIDGFARRYIGDLDNEENARQQMQGANEVLFGGEGLVIPFRGKGGYHEGGKSYIEKSYKGFSRLESNETKYGNIYKYFDAIGYLLVDPQYFPTESLSQEPPELSKLLFVGYCEGETEFADVRDNRQKVNSFRRVIVGASSLYLNNSEKIDNFLDGPNIDASPFFQDGSIIRAMVWGGEQTEQDKAIQDHLQNDGHTSSSSRLTDAIAQVIHNS